MHRRCIFYLGGNVLWMKRNFKQWWSIILPISTKRTITSHLNSLKIEKDQTYDIGNADLGLGQAYTCGGTKPINGIPLL
jgi:hypothetical protein